MNASQPYLTADDEVFRAHVRAELERVVLRDADRWESDRRMSGEGWRALGGLGLLGLDHTGAGFLRSAVLLEELGRTGYAGVRAAVGVHAYMARSYLELFGSAELKERYLPAIAKGESIAALAISEANAGSDLRDLATTAEPTGDGYRVSGEKLYVANGSHADVVVTLVRTGGPASGPGLARLSLLVVEGGSPGVRRHRQDLLGWHSADICRLELTDVMVPAGRLIGRRDRALLHLARALDFERLVAGLLAVGGVGHCLALLGRFARQHRVRGTPLTSHQAVRHRLADLQADFALVRQYGYHVAWLQSQGRLDSRSASTLKLKATELAVAAAQVCLQFHGARGFLGDSVAARLYRDASAGTLAAGASELLRDMIMEDAAEII